METSKQDHTSIVHDFMYEQIDQVTGEEKPDRAVYERYLAEYPQFSDAINDSWMLLNGVELSLYDLATDEHQYKIIDDYFSNCEDN